MNFLPQPHGCAPYAPSISVRHVRLNEETRPTLRTIIIIRDDSTLTASLVCSTLNRYCCDSDLQIQTNRTVLRVDPIIVTHHCIVTPSLRLRLRLADYVIAELTISQSILSSY